MAASGSSSIPHVTQSDEEEIWDDEYDCPRVNDILYPLPINQRYPQEAGAHFGRRRRELHSSESLETRTYSFQLFRCEGLNNFILATNEVATVNKAYYILTPFENNGQRKMKAKETIFRQSWVLSPVVGEIYPNDLSNRSNLPIEQRLEGSWQVELRKRASLKTEKFYRHDRVSNKTFRSMNEVATFIAYNKY